MHSDSEPAAGALAPHTTSSALAERLPATATGGAGLFDHAAQDPFPRAAGAIAGLSIVVLTLAVTVALVAINPAFTTGRAAGTPNQLAVVAPPPVLEPGTPAYDGLTIIQTKPCGGCHVIPGVPGATGLVGPSLAGVASKPRIAGNAVPHRTADDFKAWIQNPGALKPGTAMPSVGLTDDEATKIAAFLETLR